MTRDIGKISQHPTDDEVFRGFVDLFVKGHRDGLEASKKFREQYPADGPERDEAMSSLAVLYAMRAIKTAISCDGLEVSWNGVNLDEENTKYSGLCETLQERLEEGLAWSEVLTWSPIEETPEATT